MKSFKYLGSLFTHQNFIHKEINVELKQENYVIIQSKHFRLLCSRLLPKNLKIKLYKIIILSVLLCEKMMPYLMVETQFKGIWEQGLEENIWARRSWAWGVEKFSP